MAYPVIGVTTMRQEDPAGIALTFQTESYVKALTLAEGCPLLILTDLDNPVVNELLPPLDGVLSSGGGDIDTQLLGTEKHPKVVKQRVLW